MEFKGQAFQVQECGSNRYRYQDALTLRFGTKEEISALVEEKALQAENVLVDVDCFRCAIAKNDLRPKPVPRIIPIGESTLCPKPKPVVQGRTTVMKTAPVVAKAKSVKSAKRR